jgi:hypothetical protein
VYIAQALLSSGIIVLAYLVGRRFLPAAGALGAAALTALSPHLINANAYLLSETVFCVLVIAALWVFSRWRPPSGVIIPLLAGMLLGAAAVTRPWIQYFVVVASGALLLAHGKAKSPRGAGALVVGFAVVFAWWLGRNLVTLGASGDDTLLINGLHHGLYRGFMFEGNPETFGYPYRFDPRAAEISRSLATTLGEILRRFQDDFWSHFAWYTWGKISAVLSWALVQGAGEIFVYPPLASPYLDNPLFRASKDLMSVLHAPLMVLSVAGAALAWLPVRFLRIPADGIYTLRAIALLLWYFLAVHCVTAPFPRYAIPIRPISYMLAMFMIGVIVQWSITWVRRKNTTLNGESSA